MPKAGNRRQLISPVPRKIERKFPWRAHLIPRAMAGSRFRVQSLEPGFPPKGCVNGVDEPPAQQNCSEQNRRPCRGDGKNVKFPIGPLRPPTMFSLSQRLGRGTGSPPESLPHHCFMVGPARQPLPTYFVGRQSMHGRSHEPPGPHRDVQLPKKGWASAGWSGPRAENSGSPRETSRPLPGKQAGLPVLETHDSNSVVRAQGA